MENNVQDVSTLTSHFLTLNIYSIYILGCKHGKNTIITNLEIQQMKDKMAVTILKRKQVIYA